ncbi:35363_t:CDS:1, partial [Racocetra persica]
MSQTSFSPQYYEILQQIQKTNEYNKDRSIVQVKEEFDSIPVTIPDNFIINEVKLDDKYRIKSKEYLEDGLKIYEDVIDEKWKDFNDDGLCGEWLKVKDREDTGRVVLYMFGGGYYMGSPKSFRNLTHQIAESAECSIF